MLLNISLDAQTFSGGNGTEIDPYLISNINDLNELADSIIQYEGRWEYGGYRYFYTEGRYFKLTNDITDSVRIPMRELAGCFDGNGFTIHLAIRDTLPGYWGGDNWSTRHIGCGLFRNGRSVNYGNATIKNLTIDGYIYSRNSSAVAGFIGVSDGGTEIYNCVNLASIYAEDKFGTWCDGGVVSGIINYYNSCKIYNCINLGTIMHDNRTPQGIAYERDNYNGRYRYPRNNAKLNGWSEYTVADSIKQITDIIVNFDSERYGIFDCINAGLRICTRGYSGGAVYAVDYKRILDVGSNWNMDIDYHGYIEQQTEYWTGNYKWDDYWKEYVEEHKPVPYTQYVVDDRELCGRSSCISDMQIVSPHKDYYKEGIATNNMLGNALASKLGSRSYKYETDLYPRLGNRDVDYVAAAAVIFNKNNTSNSVTKNFKVTTAGGKVKWEALNNRVKIDNNGNATLLSYGKDMLVASIGKIKKYIPIQITDSTLSHDSVGLKLETFSRFDLMEGGSAIGGGKYATNSEITISAIPDSGYVFLYWVKPFTDTVVSRQAKYTFKITEDLHYFALFGRANQILNVKELSVYTFDSSDALTNQLKGVGKYKMNDTVVLTAIPDSHQYFYYWNADCAPRFTDDCLIMHEFIDTTYKFQHPTFINYKHIDSATITFIATENNQDNYGRDAWIRWWEPRFIPAYYINLTTKPLTAKGSVKGGGKYIASDTVVISATTDVSCYHFIEWRDSSGKTISTKNPDTLIKRSYDENIIAIFEVDSVSITTSKNIAEAGEVTGNGKYECMKTVIISATPNDCWHFVRWEDTDRNTISLKQNDTINLKSDSNLIAIFERDSFNLTIKSEPLEAGIVTGTGTYTCENAVISATPNTCHHFVRWEDIDGNILPFKQIDTIDVSSDSNLVAIFEKDAPIILNTQPDELHFGEIWANDTETKTITITNPSQYDAVIKDVSLSQNQQYFNVATPLPFTINANNSKDVVLSFNSGIEGIYDAEVFVDGESEYLCSFSKTFSIMASVPKEEYHIFLSWDSVLNATPGDTISLTATLDSINHQNSFKFSNINFKINMDYKLFEPQKLFVIGDNNVEYPINFDFSFKNGLVATINSSHSSLISHKPLLRMEGMALLSKPITSSVFFEPFNIITGQSYIFNQIEGWIDVSKFCGNEWRGSMIFMPEYDVNIENIVDKGILNMEFNATGEVAVSIEITDIDGTVIQKEKISLEKGNVNKQIKLVKNIVGKYFIRFSADFNSDIIKQIIIAK